MKTGIGGRIALVHANEGKRMSNNCDVGIHNGLRYATVFDETILGAGCDVEVVVDLSTGKGSAIISMRRMLSPNPAFSISRDDLAAIAMGVKMAKEKSDLLAQTTEGAKGHQLNFSCGGATLVIVKPEGKPTRFGLHVGLFHREGALDDLSALELEEAVRKVDALLARVISKATTK